ncbi:MAG: hypothetical protein QXV17_04380 [Candidatus Micrarchaeaceae archaeon]
MKDDNEHNGFHFFDHGEGEGIYYGTVTQSGELFCNPIAKKVRVVPYSMIKDGVPSPYVYFEIGGSRGNCPAGEFYSRLKSHGYPLPLDMIHRLTNALVSKSREFRAYEGVGYVPHISEMETDKKKKRIQEMIQGKVGDEVNEVIETVPPVVKIKLIPPSETYIKFSGDLPTLPSLDDIASDLLDLYNATTDKEAFIIAFSYSLFAPFASIVRKKRLFFPNLIFLGLPETGKNSLLNLFLAKMWGADDNIMVTQDFRTDFSALKNLQGSGLPLVINDLRQSEYQKLEPFLLEGAMNPKGGSRGLPSLDVQKFETMRGIAISSNFLSIGGMEFTSRFFIHQLTEIQEGNAEEWNRIAEKLENGMYPIAKEFIKYINENMDLDTFLDYFRENRLSVKQTILDFGVSVLRKVFSRVAPSVGIPAIKYQEYLDDYLTLFAGWVQLALRKMQKETNYYERDYDSRETITIRYENSLYIREGTDSEGKKEYVIFPLAWTEFLKKYPEFPFKSMDAFAKAYPDSLRSQPRQFKINSERGMPRRSFRVLVLKEQESMEVPMDIVVPEKPVGETQK